MDRGTPLFKRTYICFQDLYAVDSETPMDWASRPKRMQRGGEVQMDTQILHVLDRKNEELA